MTAQTEQTDTTVREWIVLEENVPTLRKLVDKLNRKAAKHGLSGLGLSVNIAARQVVEDGADVWYTVPVTVTGETPRLNGWQFVATIQHAGEAGNILRTVPTLDESLVIPESYRTIDPACDHCHYSRRRNDTFLVYSETDGFRQIGRNCLADFIGSDKVAGKMAQAEMWSLVNDACMSAQEYGYGSGGERRFLMDELLAFAAQVVLTEGWVPRSKAAELGRAATADLTLTAIDKARKDARLYPGVDARRLAENVLEWAPAWIERERGNDYVWNMSVVMASPYVPMRSVGLAVSAIGAYQRDMQHQLERKAKAATSPSQHVGTVGKRQTFDNLTCQAIRYLESQFGVTTLLTFTDPSGNIIKWFASSEPDIEPDQTVTLVATVKAHGDWNGTPETTITRAKVK